MTGPEFFAWATTTLGWEGYQEYLKYIKEHPGFLRPLPPLSPEESMKELVRRYNRPPSAPKPKVFGPPYEKPFLSKIGEEAKRLDKEEMCKEYGKEIGEIITKDNPTKEEMELLWETLQTQ
jgi:hypothetical protein